VISSLFTPGPRRGLRLPALPAPAPGDGNGDMGCVATDCGEEDDVGAAAAAPCRRGTRGAPGGVATFHLFWARCSPSPPDPAVNKPLRGSASSSGGSCGGGAGRPGYRRCKPILVSLPCLLPPPRRELGSLLVAGNGREAVAAIVH
jgi:hypothetical protein